MLRSLVGSEMCIRDRKQTVVNGLGLFTMAYAISLFLETENALIVLGSVCLLYTSDAADDLLCVDLGGRRIIKKKKTNRQNSMLSNTQTTNRECDAQPQLNDSSLECGKIRAR